MSDNAPPIPGYKILKQMGQGGMATVYLAVQESFGRQVALKIMSDQLGQDDVWTKRFMHEARVVSQLSHSNIVPVFDVGSHEGRFYISMELLKGGKLDEKIVSGLSIADVIKIVCGVAAGLDYAGSKGFVHRDIKPDNIMFRDDGTPVILDFGIAKQKDGDSKMTKTGTIVGTTGYMSPEQAMGLELDERSDIYSLGVMLYELLTGQVPFRGDSAVAVLLKHVQEAPPSLPAHLSVFQPILDRALSKKPEDRYKRGSEMLEHLQELHTRFKQQSSTVATEAKTIVLNAISANDVTIITSPVKADAATQQQTAVSVPPKNRKPLFAIVAVMAISLITVAGFQLSEKKIPGPVSNTTKTASTADVEVKNNPATAPTKEVATVAASAAGADSDNKRVIARILLGAHACLKQHKYDCAKSKAESALDLDPDNVAAKKIITNADKAQKAAFSGDWNAE